MTIDVASPNVNDLRRDQHNEDEDSDEEEDIAGPGKLPFRSKSYDLVPDESKFADPLSSPPAALSAAAFGHNAGADALHAPVPDRPDFGAQPSPSSSEDTEQLIPPCNSKPKLWTPMCLSKLYLVLFAAVFLLLLLITGLVYHLSLRNEGLAVASEAQHYLGRCLPIALFVLVAVFWRQINYHIKSLMPWSEMARFPSTAEKSVFVDYITLALPVGFYRAIRNRHWPVMLSSLAYMLLIGTVSDSRPVFSSLADVFSASFILHSVSSLETQILIAF